MNEKWPEWLFEYDYAGSTWLFRIPAPTAEDAKRRVASLALYGRLQGELKARIEVPDAGVAPTGWLLRLWCWWKNR